MEGKSREPPSKAQQGGGKKGQARSGCFCFLFGVGRPPPTGDAAFGNPKVITNGQPSGGPVRCCGRPKVLGVVPGGNQTCPLWGLLIAWVACKAPPVLVRQATRGALRTPLCHRPIAALPTCHESHDDVALCSLVGVDRYLERASGSSFSWPEWESLPTLHLFHPRPFTGENGEVQWVKGQSFLFFFFSLVQILLSGSLATSQSFAHLKKSIAIEASSRQFGDPRRGPS